MMDPGDDDDNYYSFQGVLIHEIGHVLGMNHPDQCPGNPVSIMREYDDLVGDHLFPADMMYLRQNYGTYDFTGRSRTTSDGLSLTAGPSASATFAPANRYAATSDLPGTNYLTFLAWNDATNQSISAGWYVVSNGWINLGVIPGAQTFYHPGISFTAPYDVRVSFLGNYDFSTGNSWIMDNTSHDSGYSWNGNVGHSACQVPVEPLMTTGNGISSAYDPESGEMITVWRGGEFGSDQRNSIFIQVGGYCPQQLVYGYAAPFVAADTPSVACGDVGTYNCLIAWPNGKDWSRHVQWGQFQAHSDGTLLLAPVQTLGYMSLGSAEVGFLNDPTYPWIIAVNQGATTYTYRKGPAYNDQFQNERQFSDSPMATIAAAGTMGQGEHLAFFTGDRP